MLSATSAYWAGILVLAVVTLCTVRIYICLRWGSFLPVQGPAFGAQLLPSDGLVMFVLSMRGLNDEGRLHAFRKAWSAVDVLWEPVFTEHDRVKGAGSAFGHRRAWGLAEASGCELCVFLEDDAVAFDAEGFRGDVWRLWERWPRSSAFLLLGGWNIERGKGFDLNASLKEGLCAIDRGLGAYGYAVRGHDLHRLQLWANATVFRVQRRKYSIDTALWDFWERHGGAYVATPLLVDHADGYSFTHGRHFKGRGVWQGRRDWWNVWPELVDGAHLPARG